MSRPIQLSIDQFRRFWQVLRQQGPWFFVTLGGIAVAAVAFWPIWHAYGADQTIAASSLWTAHGLTVVNLAVSLAILEKESFASYLLLGATLTSELLALVFLYLI